MGLLLLLFMSCVQGSLLKARGGGFGLRLGTKSAISNIASDVKPIITEGETRKGNEEEIATFETASCFEGVGSMVSSESQAQQAQDTNLGDIVNFMEFVQTTSTSVDNVGRDVAMGFYNVAVAAMEWGNTVVAQENMARAIGALENDNSRRKKRSDDTFDAQALFSLFRKNMGVDNLKKLLHLEKNVNIAFVIDTSSSMSDDMQHVRSYIAQIIEEQQRAGVEATFYVTTFADPNVSPVKRFTNKASLNSYLLGLTPSIGGDCEEKTCMGILTLFYGSNFMQLRNSVVYVFTDASSKDCNTQSYNIGTVFQAMRIPIFFILFDTCKTNVDKNYVAMAEKTNGFCLLIRENSVYNITDTVNGAFERDALIAGDSSDNANSVIGQGTSYTSRKKRSVKKGRQPVREEVINPIGSLEDEDPTTGVRDEIIDPVGSLEEEATGYSVDVQDGFAEEMSEGPSEGLPGPIGADTGMREEEKEEEEEEEDEIEEQGTVRILEKEILVDSSIKRARIIVSVTPVSLLNTVLILKPEEEMEDENPLCRDSNLLMKRSLADTSIVFDVTATGCPCTGYWRLAYPDSVTSITYTVKSSGPELVEFEAYFVDETGPVVIANYAPCLAIQEYLVIKVTQFDKTDLSTMTVKLVAVAGNTVSWEGTLAEYQEEEYSGAFIIPLTIPPGMGTEGFRVYLDGNLVDGTRFQRISSNYFYPTSSCMRMTEVVQAQTPAYILKSRKKTYLTVVISNKGDQGELHLLTCSNSLNYAVAVGNPTLSGPNVSRNSHNRKSNPVFLESGQTATFTVSVNGPDRKKEMVHGRTVMVTCELTTGTDRIVDNVRLTEMTK